MLSKGFAYNTIVGYRIAVSETHEHVDGYSIETRRDVAKTMLSIHIDNPPPIHSYDPIDITPSLDYIKN
ncbi:hypothetical protein C1646_697977 [Rhizophagus diaphanus]|nr:hypothetical protein C1646_697977 [Rhizophagus diaphanus] [Rhizophagus sp. MUCL 43196]